MATISGQGLRWIASLVLLLWVCVVAEHAMVAGARRDAAKVILELSRMRDGQRPIPVSHPGKLPALGTKSVLG